MNQVLFITAEEIEMLAEANKMCSVARFIWGLILSFNSWLNKLSQNADYLHLLLFFDFGGQNPLKKKKR